jgi:hypothetical protein
MLYILASKWCCLEAMHTDTPERWPGRVGVMLTEYLTALNDHCDTQVSHGALLRPLLPSRLASSVAWVLRAAAE